MTHDTSSDLPSRSAALRTELVAQVAESVTVRRAPAGRVAIAAVLAFALAGATTGGAVAANGVLASASSVELSMDEMLMVSFPGTQFFGTPLIITGSGATTVDLGPRPDGATALALRVGCIDAGRYDVAIDGVDDSWVQCSEMDVASGPSVAGFSNQYDVTETVPQSLTVRGAAEDRYVMWVSWSAPPTTPISSQAQRDALADGVVTREEYVAGLDRYIACMEENGWSVAVIDREAEVIGYRIQAIAGMDDAKCYAAEFYELDMGWQISRE